ncbi:MAG: PAS domain-containing protein [Methylicorpusculum sp.]|nr:PAS domain-containing protein [Methylicorpusculum sp.]MDO8941450.1 PAS domain-containing protein [Methylicorpusculum sp.]MDO9239814.1 PAS domain-containing protein [Methylicorpusculum sp.]
MMHGPKSSALSQEAEILLQTLALSLDLQLLKANQHACEWLGNDMDELLQSSPPDIGLSGINDGNHQPFVKLIAGQTSHLYFDQPFRHKNGQTLWGENGVSALYDKSGLIFGMLVMINDITQRRKTEQRFRTMANAAPVLIWISGLDKLYCWFNKVWLDFTGRNVEDEYGMVGRKACIQMT